MCLTYQEICITVSSHFPTMSVTYQANFFKGCDREKKGRGEKREKGGNSDNYNVASRPSNGNRLQSCNLYLFSHSGCDISQELYHFKQAFWKCGLCSNYFLLFPIGALDYDFCFYSFIGSFIRNQKKHNVNTIQIKF